MQIDTCDFKESLSTHMISADLFQKWQKIVDILAEILDVTAGLIMKARPPLNEVFVSSKSPNNPYHSGDSENLAGTYCERTLKTKSMHIVPNALKDPQWKNNPDVKLNMISYVGIPIMWPNQEVFGTLCMLDSKEIKKIIVATKILKEFSLIIEDHLSQILTLEKLQKVSNEKSHVVGVLSHDLRNPLTVIRNSIAILMHPDTTMTASEIEEYLTMIDKSSAFMENLIEKLLDSAEIEEGELIINAELINYKKFLENIVDRTRIIASPHRIQVKLTYTSTNTFVSLDPVRIEQAINNLLSNAIKYTPDDSTIELAVESPTQTEILTKVIDEGIGIKESDARRILQEYGVGSVPNIRKEKSLGLGLTIVQRVIEKHRGTFGFVSEFGKGATFYFTLPIHQQNKP